MRQALVWSLALVLLPSAASVKANPTLDDLLATMSEGAKRQDCASVAPTVEALEHTAGFAKLPEHVRLYAHGLGFYCAWEARHTELALHHVREGTLLSGASPELWQARFAMELTNKQYTDAFKTAETIAQTLPDTLNGFEMGNLFYLVRELKSQPDLRRRFLKILASPSFVPAKPGSSSAYFRQECAIVLADAGDRTGAAGMVASIDAPKIIKSMSLDPRLRAFVPPNLDLRAAVERHMDRMREIAAAHATVIQPQLNVVEDLLMLDKGEEALATLDAIRPDQSAQAYADSEDQINWWWNSKAKAYALLGRYEDAQAAYRKGKENLEHSKPNISQTINLSEMQLRFGHPADALETLAPIAEGKVPGSPYGMMQFRTNHGCASHRVGKKQNAEADLAYLREHVADAPSSLTSMQLCMGDIDGAATSIIMRLDNPDQSAEALSDLSDYAPAPNTYPGDPDAPALEALKARADVKAAVLRAGGTRKFNVSS